MPGISPGLAVGTSGVVMAAAAGGIAEWSGTATAIVGAGAILLGAGIAALGRIDKARMNRIKEWDEFNKDSLSKQLEEATRTSEENQLKMRESLHEIKDNANAAYIENANLRGDLVAMGKHLVELSAQLHITDNALLLANQALREATTQLAEVRAALSYSQEDRARLSKELTEVRSRLDKLERPS